MFWFFARLLINVAERFKMKIIFTSDSAGRVCFIQGIQVGRYFFYKWFMLENWLKVVQLGNYFSSDSGWRVFYKWFRWESLFYKWFRWESLFLQVIPLGEFVLQVIPLGDFVFTSDSAGRVYFTSDSAGRVYFTSDSSWRAFYKWFKLDSILIRWWLNKKV